MKLKENILYEIYTQDPDNFDVGYYLMRDEQYLLFSSLNADGLDNGFTVIKTDTVNHAEYETTYCDKILKLSKYHNTEKRKNVFQSSKLIEQLLKYAKENKSIVSVELQNSENTDLYGFIFDYDRDYVYITEVDRYGFVNGKSISKIEDINRMTLDEYSDLRVKILYNLNYKSLE